MTNFLKKISILALLALGVSLPSCDAFRTVTSTKVTSQGAPYELIVVCDQPLWDGALGDTLRSVLQAPVQSINQSEPLFDVLRVTERGFKDLVEKHRNILDINITPDSKEPIVAVQYDTYASPQVVLSLFAKSAKEATQYISDNREALVLTLETVERDRDIAYAEKFNEKHIKEVLLSKFGFELNVPKGYTIRNEAEDFVWVSYEYPQSSQGFFVYSYPYKGARSLTPEALVKARQKYAAMIPGPSDGSFMTTFTEYEPDYTTFRIDGRLWVEMRGLWDVQGDFMGGPFVSYTTVNTQTNRVVTIDCYVYSPKVKKRNYIRGLEHLIYMVNFPEGGVSEQSK